MDTTLKVFKWDDDLAVELPKELVDQLALKEGDELDISAAPAVGAEVGTKETPDTWTK
ncbi:AbrB/MazE/SpoVT family DNA-binding domain-containing protein [Bradyrhizobium manausense]|uniref:AbrB/MazE/SpoVT family DNA-binding domain-containing protein n=1 Tax=Bradyrhizobium manausense TaxID=989370 RepID=UPI0020112580|nr:AbrB/MazE/SpoVT family DNA-binding domain-containing protein [Bradyrhizobium manausense]